MENFYPMKAVMAFIYVGGFLAVQPTNLYIQIASDISAIDDLAVRSTKLEAAGQWPELSESL